MRKALAIAVVLTLAVVVPGTAHAASTAVAAVLGLAIGGAIGVYGFPLLLPSAIAAAPAAIDAISTAATTAGTAIVANPQWSGGIIGGLLGLLLAP